MLERPQQPRSRRLGLEHRDEAREARRREPARARAASSPTALGAVDGVASVEVAGPGFINITPRRRSRRCAREDDRRRRRRVRHATTASPVRPSTSSSSRPTRPARCTSATPGGPRSATRSRACSARPAPTLVSEYYINDAGNQMDNFGGSILAAAKGEPTPEGGYPGAYIAELAARVLAEIPDLLELARDGARAVARELRLRPAARGDPARPSSASTCTSTSGSASARCTRRPRRRHEPHRRGRGPAARAGARVRRRGRRLGAHDRLRRRQGPRHPSRQRRLHLLRRRRRVLPEQGRPRLRSTRSTCSAPTTTATSHRLKALAGAAGDDPERDIEVLIGQLVSVNGARLSSAPATSSSSTTCIAWLGTDALRYSLGRYPADSPLDARPREAAAAGRTTTPSSTCSTPTPARARWRATPPRPGSTAAPSHRRCSSHETESALLGVLQEFPRIVAQAAQLREPHRVARHLEETRRPVPQVVRQLPGVPMGEEPITDLHRTRLWLNDATGTGHPQRTRRSSASPRRSACSFDAAADPRGRRTVPRERSCARAVLLLTRFATLGT